MPVRVTFEQHADPDGDVYIPLFEPDQGERGRDRAGVHQRRRAVRDRSTARARSVGAHARRVPRRDRGRRAHARRHRRPVDVPGPDVDARRLLRRRRVRRDRRAAPQLSAGTTAGSRRRVSSARSSRRAWPSGAGMCDHVLCFRSVWEGSAQGEQGRSAVMPGGEAAAASRPAGSWSGTSPFSAPSAAIWIAMFAQAHFHKYGTTKEQLAWIALNAPPQRRAQPEGDLPRPDDDGRLHGVAHDHDAVLVCTTATCRATARPR